MPFIWWVIEINSTVKKCFNTFFPYSTSLKTQHRWTSFTSIHINMPNNIDNNLNDGLNKNLNMNNQNGETDKRLDDTFP